MVLVCTHLQNWVIYGVHVGKYSSTMDRLGMEKWWEFRIKHDEHYEKLNEKHVMRDDEA